MRTDDAYVFLLVSAINNGGGVGATVLFGEGERFVKHIGTCV